MAALYATNRKQASAIAWEVEAELAPVLIQVSHGVFLYAGLEDAVYAASTADLSLWILASISARAAKK